MGVGQPELPSLRGEQHHGLQHEALEPRNLRVVLPAETGTRDDVHLFGAHPSQHREHVLDLVLAVGVESDEVLGSRLAAGVFHTCLQGSALPQVHGVID